MKNTAILAIGLAALAISACAPGHYRDGYYDRPGYGDRDRYYSDRDRSYGDRDRDGIPNRADRDRDNDGVPNYADRRPNNPYSN